MTEWHGSATATTLQPAVAVPCVVNGSFLGSISAHASTDHINKCPELQQTEIGTAVAVKPSPPLLSVVTVLVVATDLSHRRDRRAHQYCRGTYCNS